MSLGEKFQYWRLQRRFIKNLQKMDYYLVKNKQKACKYEDLLSKADDELYLFMKKMYIKYI